MICGDTVEYPDSITYDAIGNPLTYRDGMTMTWEGRQLKNLISNGVTNTYSYDADGLRIKKTAGSLATVYQYVNGQLLRERRSNGVVLRYAYDSLGNLATIQYTNIDNWTRTYYVRTKINGDVDQIYDTSGNLIAKYTYDAWGNTVAITDANGKAITASTHVAVVNPIRYRGYYWDAETGFYYLQSRYYDPETKRFVNADGYVFTGQDMRSGNMFAYCGNCPVNRYDPNGNMHMSDGGGESGIIDTRQQDWIRWRAKIAVKNIANKTGLSTVINNLSEDIRNFDATNTSEKTALEANYFSMYKDVWVFRAPIGNSGLSFEVFFR